jgi:hypothetical protein
MGRPIADNSEAGRQRAKVSPGKNLKRCLCFSKFSVSRLKESPHNVLNCQRTEVSRLLICRHRNSGGALVPQIGHNVSICVRAGLPKPRLVPDTERIKDTKTLDYASTPLDANTLLAGVFIYPVLSFSF